MEFKDIPGFPGYKVNENGVIIGKLRKTPLSPANNGNGYFTVHMRINGKPFRRYIHRLVAITFIPNPLGLPEVNHKDKNKANNCVENLEWITRLDNIRHSFRLGRPPIDYTKRRGEFHPRSKQVLDITTGIVFNCAREAAECYDIKRGYLISMLNGGCNNKTNLIYL